MFLKSKCPNHGADRCRPTQQRENRYALSKEQKIIQLTKPEKTSNLPSDCTEKSSYAGLVASNKRWSKYDTPIVLVHLALDELPQALWQLLGYIEKVVHSFILFQELCEQEKTNAERKLKLWEPRGMKHLRVCIIYYFSFGKARKDQAADDSLQSRNPPEGHRFYRVLRYSSNQPLAVYHSLLPPNGPRSFYAKQKMIKYFLLKANKSFDFCFFLV